MTFPLASGILTGAQRHSSNPLIHLFN